VVTRPSIADRGDPCHTPDGQSGEAPRTGSVRCCTAVMIVLRSAVLVVAFLVVSASAFVLLDLYT
jgi:hypothetical protein